MNIRPTLLAMVMMTLLLAACARTHVTSVWRKPGLDAPAPRTVMILAQAGNRRDRAVWEDTITERFRRSGVDAMAAATAFPVDRPANPLAVIDHAREKGIDGVLVINQSGTRTVSTYHPPQTHYYSWYPYPYWGWYPWPYGFRRHYPWPPAFYGPPLFYDQEVVVTPGYTSRYRVARVETYLYLAGTGEQVWSMSLESVEPMSDMALIADISRAVFRGLRRAGLVRLTR